MTITSTYVDGVMLRGSGIRRLLTEGLRMSKYQDLTEYEESTHRDRVRDVKRKTEGRAKRRFAAAKAKKEVVKKDLHWQHARSAEWSKKLIEDPRYVGKQAGVHSASCSCWMCRSPRKNHGNGEDGLTLQERRDTIPDQDEDWRDEQ